MTDIPEAILSRAREIYEGSWPDPVRSIAEALMEASQQWQPIETAPKGGDDIILWGGCYHYEESFGDEYRLMSPVTGYWYSTRWVIGKGDGHDNFCVLTKPTHWMPLPKPPSSSEDRP